MQNSAVKGCNLTWRLLVSSLPAVSPHWNDHLSLPEVFFYFCFLSSTRCKAADSPPRLRLNQHTVSAKVGQAKEVKHGLHSLVSGGFIWSRRLLIERAGKVNFAYYPGFKWKQWACAWFVLCALLSCLPIPHASNLGASPLGVIIFAG